MHRLIRLQVANIITATIFEKCFQIENSVYSPEEKTQQQQLHKSIQDVQSDGGAGNFNVINETMQLT